MKKYLKEEEVIHEENKRAEKKKNIRTDRKEALHLDDYVKISEIKNKIKTLNERLINTVHSINEEIERNLVEIKRVENEINDLRMKKLVFRYRLKECYINILKSTQITM